MSGAKIFVDAYWESGAGRSSWQVLHEFYSNATRKTKVPVVAARLRQSYSGFRTGGAKLVLHDKAQLPYWDGLILASAERLACSILLSEDFEAERNYEGVRAANPFQQSPHAIGLDPS